MIWAAASKVGAAFTVGEWSFQWYGIIMVAAICVALLLMRSSMKKKGLDPDMILELALIVIPMGIIGARFHYVLWSWHEFAGQPFWHVFAFWEGGLAIYGAVLFGMLGLFIYARWRKLSFAVLLDCLVPALALAQGIGRWGNFANQEVYGAVVTNPAQQFFPLSVLIDADGQYHYALFFYEFVLNVLLFLLLYFVIDRKAKKPGTTALHYLLCYGIYRAVLEGFRDEPYIQRTAGLPMNRIVAILVAAVAAVLLIRMVVKGRQARYSRELSDDLVLIHDRKKVVVDYDGNVLNKEPEADEEEAGDEAPAEEAAEEAEAEDSAEETEEPAERSEKPAKESEEENE